MSPTVVQVFQSCRDGLRYDVSITLLAAGLIFLLALVLGVWKYRQVLVSDDHRAHPYVDIAHRAALLYSFATLLIAVFVQFSAWPAWVNLTAAMVLVFFFVAAILGYIEHGRKRDTDNQFANPARALRAGMVALVVGEVGGFAVLLAGFIAGQWF
jgi:Ca2+/Na+ antiporter